MGATVHFFIQAGSPHTPLLMSTDSEDESESKTEEVSTIDIENVPTENEILVFPGKQKRYKCSNL